MHHWQQFKTGLLVVFSLGLFVVGFGVSAHAATTATIVSQSSMTPTTYVRKAATGWTYNLDTSGSTVTFGAKSHYLANYPSTTWEATKKMTLKKTGRITCTTTFPTWATRFTVGSGTGTSKQVRQPQPLWGWPRRNSVSHIVMVGTALVRLIVLA